MATKTALDKYSSIISSSWKGGSKTINQFNIACDFMSEKEIGPVAALAIEYNFVTENIEKKDKYVMITARYKFERLNLKKCPTIKDVVEKCFHPFDLSIDEARYKLMIDELKKRGESNEEILEAIYEYSSNANDLMDGWV